MPLKLSITIVVHVGLSHLPGRIWNATKRFDKNLVIGVSAVALLQSTPNNPISCISIDSQTINTQ